MIDPSRPHSIKACAPEAVAWLRVERLGELAMDARMRHWLIGNGLLTVRMKALIAERFAARLAEQWSGRLSAAERAALGVADQAALYREVELSCGPQVWAHEQTIIPDSTLSAHAWLAELGDTELNEMLASLSKVSRAPYEYAWLPSAERAAQRALRHAQLKPAGLWARRQRISLRGAPCLLVELFMPAVGRP